MSLSVLVTGANKGIGFEIVRRLLTVPTVTSITFTSRDLANGEDALKKFQLENAHAIRIELLQLDLLDDKSVKLFLDELIAKKLQFDSVIFNAGIAFYNVINQKANDMQMITNFYRNVELTKHFIDSKIIKENGRFVYVSSMMGSMAILKAKPEIHKLFLGYKSLEFTEKELFTVAKQYEKEIMDSKLAEGWPKSVYAFSKLCLTIYTAIASRQYPNFTFYACCPGWCKTDMTKGTNAPKSAEEGADTPVWLATDTTLPPTANGNFFYERKEDNERINPISDT